MVEFADTKTIFLIRRIKGQKIISQGGSDNAFKIRRANLNLLNQEMLHMGTMIEESIQVAIEAFINQDIEKAHKIMEGTRKSTMSRKKIENICFNLLIVAATSLQRDLRTISATMKMVTDMERIGDHASDISEMTVMMSKTEYKVNIEDVKKWQRKLCLCS